MSHFPRRERCSRELCSRTRLHFTRQLGYTPLNNGARHVLRRSLWPHSIRMYTHNTCTAETVTKYLDHVTTMPRLHSLHSFLTAKSSAMWRPIPTILKPTRRIRGHHIVTMEADVEKVIKEYAAMDAMASEILSDKQQVSSARQHVQFIIFVYLLIIHMFCRALTFLPDH